MFQGDLGLQCCHLCPKRINTPAQAEVFLVYVDHIHDIMRLQSAFCILHYHCSMVHGKMVQIVLHLLHSMTHVHTEHS